jgi:hypothetical protein
MQHPDEGTIHAWLDGELSAEEAQSLESHIAGCAECSSTVAEARGLIAASSRIVSALDIIPAGVIPAAPTIVKRPWYSSVQFRAAAGILVVAGASALLFSGGQNRAARETLAVARPVLSEAPVIQDSRATPDSAVIATPAPPPQAKKKMEKILDAPASVSVPSATVAQSAAPAANEAQQLVRPLAAERSAASIGGAVVKGGLAVSAMDEASPSLKLLKADTASVTVRNVYEVSKGVEVTLTETTLPQKNFGTARRDRQAQPMVSAPASPPPQAKAADAATNSIMWSKGDKVFTLTGSMSKAELEALRLRLPEDKR